MTPEIHWKKSAINEVFVSRHDFLAQFIGMAFLFLNCSRKQDWTSPQQFSVFFIGISALVNLFLLFLIDNPNSEQRSTFTSNQDFVWNLVNSKYILQTIVCKSNSFVFNSSYVPAKLTCFHFRIRLTFVWPFFFFQILRQKIDGELFKTASFWMIWVRQKMGI